MIGNVVSSLDCRSSGTRWWSLRRYAIVRARLGVEGTVAGNHRGRARSFACADSHGN